MEWSKLYRRIGLALIVIAIAAYLPLIESNFIDLTGLTGYGFRAVQAGMIIIAVGMLSSIADMTEGMPKLAFVFFFFLVSSFAILGAIPSLSEAVGRFEEPIDNQGVQADEDPEDIPLYFREGGAAELAVGTFSALFVFLVLLFLIKLIGPVD